MAAAIAALSFSPLSCTHSRSLSLIFLSNISLLYRHFMVNMEGPIALKHGMNCGTIHASTCLVVGYCHKWQYPNNHPLCHLCGQLSSYFFSTGLHLQHRLASCSSSKLTILRVSSTQHSLSSVSIMLGPEWFFKLYTKAYNTPSNKYSKCDNHLVFQCDHKLTTLPRVYSSRSCACPLFHPRNHALLLRESLALSRKSPGSSPPLTMGATH